MWFGGWKFALDPEALGQMNNTKRVRNRFLWPVHAGRRFATGAVLLLLLAFLPCPGIHALADAGCSGADAARTLRLVSRGAEGTGQITFADQSRNGELNETDVQIALWRAAGLIPDYVSFIDRLSTGLCDERLFTAFSYTGTERRSGEYRSDSVAVKITKVQKKDLCYYVADVYVQSLESFSSKLYDGGKNGSYRYVQQAAARTKAILCVNGDYYMARAYGPIIRNGVWIRENNSRARDLCIMTRDGVIRTYGAKALTIGQIREMDPWQLWLFGPGLLTEKGEPKTRFNSRLTGLNPRTALGYYEPGHYCLVVVDGRQQGYSKGITMKDLSRLFYDLGCTAAYNLDGGESSAMADLDGLVNNPFRNGRPISDFIIITEPAS